MHPRSALSGAPPASETVSASQPSVELSDKGSFVCSNDELDVEDVSEPLDRYTQGLYYPLSIGEVLNSTYQIVHKLGWGGFSTVWMARHLESHKMVALKIIIPRGVEGSESGAKETNDLEERELEMQQEILRSVADTSHLLTLIDTFSLPSPRGSHTVLVFPVRGPNLRYDFSPLPVRDRMRAAKQLLQAPKSLHEADIVVRDLNSGSVLWDIGNVDDYSIRTAYETFGRPQKAPLWAETWKEGELVKPVEVAHDRIRGNIFLADFGLAFKHGTPVRHKWQSPAVFCGPERFHGFNPSFAGDMWSYTCLLMELYLGMQPFYGRTVCSTLGNLVDNMGPLPSEWAEKYEGPGKADERWYDQSRRPHKNLTLEAIARRARPEVADAEMRTALSVFNKGLAYLPEKRPSAAELLQDPDFNALMKIHQC